MNHEIEYFNHKTRLAKLRQETKDFALSESIKQHQESVLTIEGMKQKLSLWVAKFKSQFTVQSETSATYDTSLQRE